MVPSPCHLHKSNINAAAIAIVIVMSAAIALAGQKDPIYLSIPPASARLKSNTIQTKYINWVLKFTLTNYPIMIAFNCSIDGVLNLKSIINQLSACLLCLDVDANEDISAFSSIREETSAL